MKYTVVFFDEYDNNKKYPLFVKIVEGIKKKECFYETEGNGKYKLTNLLIFEGERMDIVEKVKTWQINRKEWENRKTIFISERKNELLQKLYKEEKEWERVNPFPIFRLED